MPRRVKGIRERVKEVEEERDIIWLMEVEKEVERETQREERKGDLNIREARRLQMRRGEKGSGEQRELERRVEK